MDNVPELRFSEFTNILQLVKFGDAISSNIYGPRFNANDYDLNGNVKTIRGTDVGLDGEIKYSQVPLAKLEPKTVQHHKLNDGDLIMITTADCGVTGVFREQEVPFISSAYGVRIRLNEKGYPEYFKFFLQTSHAKNEINKYIRKATVSNLPGSDILKIKTNIPLVKEQQKISTFLSAVDKKLGHLRRKHELLESYKRGVMQKIFSPFDSAQGKLLRFKQDNGADFPDWENISFENIAKRVSTKFNPKNSNENPVLIELENIAPNMGRTTGQSVIEEQSSMKTQFNSGDVLFGKLRPYLKKFAQPSFNGVCSSEIWVLRGIKVSNNFLFFLIQISRFMQFANQSSGSKMPRSDWNVVKNSIFKIPCPEEQQKIANFLSTLDKKLEAVQKQIDQTEVFKKGLLQKMFV